MLSLDVLARERRGGLADLVQPLQVVLHLLPQVRAVAETARGAWCRPRARSPNSPAVMAAVARLSAKLAANSSCSFWPSPCIELAEPLEGFVELAGLGARHRQDDLGQRLDGPVGIGLQVLPALLLGLAEPVVLDRLVEEGGVGLVAIVGLGVLPQVFRQLADEGPVVLGLNLGDVGRQRARPTRARVANDSAPITTAR